MDLILAIDQGTSSTRVVAYDPRGVAVASFQMPLPGVFPEQGWVEQEPLVVLATVEKCLTETATICLARGYTKADFKAIGVTNQRETTVVWDRATGVPLHNAIVWLDTRTTSTVDALIGSTASKDKTALQHLCGLPISTYFSAVKLRWLFDNVPGVLQEAEAGRCLFGTIDSWILWNLSGGINGGTHVTDVTNASRTMLMNINTLQWDADLLRFFGVPCGVLPRIASSSEIYGRIAMSGCLAGVPLAGCLGDQHAALLGQHCVHKGDAKNTYGTGCFLLYNTGTVPVFSTHGLLTTVAFQLGPRQPCVYALEGAVAIAGEAVRWLRDSLGLIQATSEMEALAGAVDGTHGVYFVPAFAGLLAPHWRHDARGVIVGLTQYSNKHHIARATLEAVCFQSREVLDAMNSDSGVPLASLRVDGGMSANNLLLQLQADIIGISVVRPHNVETTSWGAAVAAGLAVNVWPDLAGVAAAAFPGDTKIFSPKSTPDDRGRRYRAWQRAVQRALGWVEGPGGAEVSVVTFASVAKSSSLAQAVSGCSAGVRPLTVGIAVACAGLAGAALALALVRS